MMIYSTFDNIKRRCTFQENALFQASMAPVCYFVYNLCAGKTIPHKGENPGVYVLYWQ
jgi:hypothetical protein